MAFDLMPIRQEDRDRIADAIERYLSREIDNFQLDNALFDAKIEDRAACEIAIEVWYFYDDFKRHKNEKRHEIPAAGEAMLRRWILFLRSDHPWPIDEPNWQERWYSPGRWQGVMAPVGCLLGLVMLPWGLFEVLVLGRPRPKSAENEYWPFRSSAEWAALR
jgi:hypothetical protein